MQRTEIGGVKGMKRAQNSPFVTTVTLQVLISKQIVSLEHK